MIKKILVTAFIAFGLFQLADVNYRMNHEGIGLLKFLNPAPAPVQVVAAASSSSVSSIVVETNPCTKAGFALNATFTSGIKARLPEFLLDAVEPERDSLVYFSELIGIKTPSVEFRWSKGGAEFYREQVDVKGMRWRVWSAINGLTKPDAQLHKTLPLTVEIWSGQCMVHADKIHFSADAHAIHLDQSASYFDYYNKTLGDVSSAFQYSQEVNNTALVYRFDEKRLNPKIYIDIENQLRNELTRDVFSRYVERDKALPLPSAKGGVVLNYSDVNINRKTAGGDTVLLEAIKNNSQNTIKSLLAIGANPFIRDAENRSPLDLALAAKNRMLVEMLLEHMISGNSVERAGWSDISFANILSSGNYAYLGGRNRLGETSLMRAAASGDEFAIIGLVGLDAMVEESESLPYQDPYHVDYAGRQAVDIAQESGYSGAVLLLEKAMERFSPSWSVYRMVIASELQGDTPTQCYIQPGQRMWLLATLVDIPVKKVKLEWSVRQSYKDTWRLVKTEEYLVTNSEYQLKSYVDSLDLGRDPIWEVQAKLYINGRPAHNGAISRNYSSASKTDCDYDNHYQKSSLKKQFAAWVPINIVSKRATGFSAENLRIYQKLLEDAVLYESPSLLQYLLESGMDPQIKHHDNSLVRKAVTNKKLALVQYLLAGGADLMSADVALRQSKRSLINDAIYENDLTMVKFLSRQGLPVTEVNAGVAQPLVKAIDNCNADMVALLLSLGANPSLQLSATENITVMDYAERCSYEPRVREVLSNNYLSEVN
ncbi:ankyrin repeat domain-containing protein [Cellvibrio sp. QJXJ]|uniref:ankyrin repeat domain-containing protein n=1 Tax=Cellvibrio sp. QJXJ TaxID=2964606 RepID=UPI0021C3BFA0|nr:ankyrin repeat domain-containing protein [Cellvibrio sp. QJXJ]UUA72750.1 ankyrin repeat domain-containing protein [Cellvibrio sp. QJXJ]